MRHERKWFPLGALDLLSLFLDPAQDFFHIFFKFPDGHGIAGMKRQGDHALHFRQINLYKPVVICPFPPASSPGILPRVRVLTDILLSSRPYTRYWTEQRSL